MAPPPLEPSAPVDAIARWSQHRTNPSLPAPAGHARGSLRIHSRVARLVATLGFYERTEEPAVSVKQRPNRTTVGRRLRGEAPAKNLWLAGASRARARSAARSASTPLAARLVASLGSTADFDLCRSHMRTAPPQQPVASVPLEVGARDCTASRSRPESAGWKSVPTHALLSRSQMRTDWSADPLSSKPQCDASALTAPL